MSWRECFCRLEKHSLECLYSLNMFDISVLKLLNFFTYTYLINNVVWRSRYDGHQLELNPHLFVTKADD